VIGPAITVGLGTFVVVFFSLMKTVRRLDIKRHLPVRELLAHGCDVCHHNHADNSQCQNYPSHPTLTTICNCKKGSHYVSGGYIQSVEPTRKEIF
jgi:hypothetical protein